MTLEERYAEQWRKDARAEGHIKRLPPSPNVNMAALKKPEAYASILAAIGDGVATITQLTIATGYSRQFVQDRLRRMKEGGKIEKVGNQWRVKE